MNKLRKISIITMILYCFWVSISYAATGTVNVSAARLREEANTTSNILTNIYRNEKVEILELQGEWYKVKYGNNIGYLKKELIKEDEVADKSENNNISTYNQNENTTQADESKIIISSSANVRIVPNIMSKVSVELEVGKELTKISEMGNWLKVTDGSFSGWILKSKTTTPTVQTQVNITDFEDSKNNIQENNQEDNKQNNKENEEQKNNQNTTTEDTSTQESVTKQENVATSVNKKGIVNVETAKVRESASPKAKVIGFLDYNDVIEISEEEGEWYKFTEKDTSGYVHKTLITISDNEKEITSRGILENRAEIKNEETNTDNTTIDSNSNNNVTDVLMSSNSQAVVDYAKQYLGYSYVVGRKNPTTGFDCSGFTRYVFLNFGYSLGATAATQNNLGTEISKENLQAGDLLIFYDEGKNKIGHTGIYISDGDFIHAANPSRGVVIDNINTNSYYRERFIVGRRIVE